MAQHTPLTGTLRRLRRGRHLTGVAIDSERLADIVHGRVVPSTTELGYIAAVLNLTLLERRELAQARHDTVMASIHRPHLRQAG